MRTSSNRRCRSLTDFGGRLLEVFLRVAIDGGVDIMFGDLVLFRFTTHFVKRPPATVTLAFPAIAGLLHLQSNLQVVNSPFE